MSKKFLATSIFTTILVIFISHIGNIDNSQPYNRALDINAVNINKNNHLAQNAYYKNNQENIKNDSLSLISNQVSMSDHSSRIAHPDDPSKQTEHMALLNLVPQNEATHIAVNSSSWFNPSTWENGQVPGDNAKVIIPHGLTVKYDGESNARLFTLGVYGEMNFATDQDTKMVIDTFVVCPQGKLTIGTKNNPVKSDIQTRIIIADNGAIDKNWDRQQLSRGLISHGELFIHGQEKTSHLKVAVAPMAGDTKIILQEAPQGWKVGDRLVLTGTRAMGYSWNGKKTSYKGTQDEELVISQIKGKQIYFTQPLKYNHDTPRKDLKAYIANYSRNVRIETENYKNLPNNQRGHTMFMHSNKVDVRYAEFFELGRTDKSKPLDDFNLAIKGKEGKLRNYAKNNNLDILTYTRKGKKYTVGVARSSKEILAARKAGFNVEQRIDAQGEPAKKWWNREDGATGARTNIRGRYAMHFHRTGVTPGSLPGIAIGNAVWGSPGWGYVHHDSNAIFENNAAYDVYGSAFMSETGNEIGAWRNNIAIKGKGLKVNAKHGTGNHDIANNGTGFWFQGRLVENENNVATGMSGHGFLYFHRGLDNMTVLSENISFPEVADYRGKVDANIPQIHNFKNNEAFASGTGLEVIKANPRQGHDVRSLLDGFTAWSVGKGAQLQYTAHYTLKDFDLVGIEKGEPTGWRMGIQDGKVGIKTGSNSFDIVVLNPNIENFKQGINLSRKKLGTSGPHDYTVVNPSYQNVKKKLINSVPDQDKILTAGEILDHPLSLEISPNADLILDSSGRDRKAIISGWKTDSLGVTDFLGGFENKVFSFSEARKRIDAGYYTLKDGTRVITWETLVADRLTNETKEVAIPIILKKWSTKDLLSLGDYQPSVNIDLADKELQITQTVTRANNKLISTSSKDLFKLDVATFGQSQDGKKGAIIHAFEDNKDTLLLDKNAVVSLSDVPKTYGISNLTSSLVSVNLNAKSTDILIEGLTSDQVKNDIILVN